jgi:transposase-like protein
MRHTREAIYEFLERQATSGQTVAAFCADHGIKVPTFYFWKKKYNNPDPVAPSGFCELTPVREVSKRKLCLPSGLQLEITGLSTREIAQLVVEIDRAHV